MTTPGCTASSSRASTERIGFRSATSSRSKPSPSKTKESVMTQETPPRPRFSRLLAVATAAAIAGSSLAAQAADLATIRIAVGGAACLCYLPTVLAEQIGAYKKAGLAIEIANLKGGSQALTAVLGGSAD